jgi:hypothetical protein
VRNRFLEHSAIHVSDHKVVDSRTQKLTKLRETANCTKEKKERQCTCNITLRCVRATVVVLVRQ